MIKSTFLLMEDITLKRFTDRKICGSESWIESKKEPDASATHLKRNSFRLGQHHLNPLQRKMNQGLTWPYA